MGIQHFFYTIVQYVILDRTTQVLVFETFPAGNTAMYLFPCELHKFCFDPLCFKFPKYVIDKNSRIAVLARTSIECDNRLRGLRSNLDKFFPKPGQYVAILEEFSSIPPPQPNIEYKNKLHVIHGIW